MEREKEEEKNIDVGPWMQANYVTTWNKMSRMLCMSYEHGIKREACLHLVSRQQIFTTVAHKAGSWRTTYLRTSYQESNDDRTEVKVTRTEFHSGSFQIDARRGEPEFSNDYANFPTTARGPDWKYEEQINSVTEQSRSICSTFPLACTYKA